MLKLKLCARPEGVRCAIVIRSQRGGAVVHGLGDIEHREGGGIFFGETLRRGEADAVALGHARDQGHLAGQSSPALHESRPFR